MKVRKMRSTVRLELTVHECNCLHKIVANLVKNFEKSETCLNYQDLNTLTNFMHGLRMKRGSLYLLNEYEFKNRREKQ